MCEKDHKNLNSATAHWYRFHYRHQGRESSIDQPPPPPPPPTPQTVSKPIKERWFLSDSTGGCHTVNARRNSAEEVMSRKQDSGNVRKTSGITCQHCRRWFRHRWELHFHMQTRCQPVTLTLGTEDLHRTFTRDISSVTRGKHPSILQRRCAAERVTSAGPHHIGHNIHHLNTNETLSINNTPSQTRATLDTDASVRDWVLPHYKAKKAT